MIIIFDGMDKVGKTTLIRALDKATDYEHIIIDRGPNSYLVYDRLYHRQYALDHLKTEMDLRNTSHLCIYCFANEEDIEKRLKEANESWAEEQGYIWSVATDFCESMSRSDLDVIKINTSKLTVEESIRIILNEIENRKYDFIKLKVKLQEKNYIEYYPSVNTFSEQILNTLPEFNKNIDRPYYEMLDASLTHLLHKKEIGWVNHRQLVYSSFDCIAMIQIVLGETTEIFVHQRSLNLQKHKTNDLMFIYDWARRNLNYEKLFIHYNVGVPHRFL